MLRALTNPGWLFEILLPPRALALPVACLLLFFGAHVSLAATINVDQSTCILQNAITSANSDTATGGCTAGSGADTINLSGMSSSYNLPGEVDQITTVITIDGTGKTINAEDWRRHFYVASGGDLTLNNITLKRGDAKGYSTGPTDGGSIYVASGGKLTVNYSKFDTNKAYKGGTIYSEGDVTIIGSSIYSSEAGNGAGILAEAGSLHISNSAIRNNDSTGLGGGVHSSATLTISNSTFTANHVNSANNGAGIYIDGGTATISHSTLHNNTIGVSATNSATALAITGTTAAVSLRNSILGDVNSKLDCKLLNSATLTQNVGNVIQTGDGSGAGACTTPNTRDEPGLGSLVSTDPVYFPPQSTSEAIGAGDASICLLFPKDQIGITRPASGCDAGSIQTGSYKEIIVNANTNNSPDTVCTLNEAIKSANENSSDNAPGCASGIADSVGTDLIKLAQDVEMTAFGSNITSTMLVDGWGFSISPAANAGNFRPFVVASGGDLTLQNITVSGFTANNGAGVYHYDGKLTLKDCVFKDNQSSNGGGALYLHSYQDGTVIDRCAFISNGSSSNSGAAIYVRGGNLEVSNSTFTDNTCYSSGCAIYNQFGQTEVYHSTFWNNATKSPGASNTLYGGGGSGTTMDIYNTIIGHSSPGTTANCASSKIRGKDQERGILVWNDKPNDFGCGNQDKIIASNPQLGGQTDFPPHLPLGAGSPARGKGIAATCQAYPTDQQGAPRPATGCDIGAVQYYVPPTSGDSDDRYERGNWVQLADGTWVWVPEPDDEEGICTGEWLNANTAIRVSATYDICSGINFERRDLAAIGIQWVIDAGPLDVVDVWGWVRPTAEVCFPQPGSMLFLNASTVQRVVEPLPSYRDGQYTCAQIDEPGTLILMPVDSPHTTPPSAGPQTPLAGCMARTNFILNLRAAPGGDVITLLPYDVTLTAYAKAAGWYEVDYHGIRGWVSGQHVTLVGACA